MPSSFRPNPPSQALTVAGRIMDETRNARELMYHVLVSNEHAASYIDAYLEGVTFDTGEETTVTLHVKFSTKAKKAPAMIRRLVELMILDSAAEEWQTTASPGA